MNVVHVELYSFLAMATITELNLFIKNEFLFMLTWSFINVINEFIRKFLSANFMLPSIILQWDFTLSSIIVSAKNFVYGLLEFDNI